MTDVLDRVDLTTEPTGVTLTSAPGRDAGPPGADAERGHWVLAALLVAAGAIHLAMAPSHLAESATLGTLFLLSGVVQVGLGLATANRPTRTVLWTSLLVSAACLAAWAVSRTVGLPLAGEAGAVEDVTLVDATCAALELVALVLAAGLLRARGRHATLLRSTGLAAVVAIGSLALMGSALASPEARDHAHSHDEGAAGHGHAPEDDLGFSALANGQMGAHAHPGTGTANADPEISAADAATLAGQLALTAPLVQAYPTLADAEAAGYTQAGPFSPGLGVHYTPPLSAMTFDTNGVIDAADIAGAQLIYDGIEPDAHLAGFMFMAYQETAPEGFAGPLDQWHFHTAVCMRYGPNGVETPFGADLSDVTDEMCEAADGRMLDFTGYMVHAWTVPGYESSLGTFSDLNPKITCTDGTYYTIPTREIGSAQTTCRNAA